MWLHSSVGRASHRYRRGHGFECRWSPDFFRLLLSNCLNWKLTVMIILHFSEFRILCRSYNFISLHLHKSFVTKYSIIIFWYSLPWYCNHSIGNLNQTNYFSLFLRWRRFIWSWRSCHCLSHDMYIPHNSKVHFLCCIASLGWNENDSPLILCIISMYILLCIFFCLLSFLVMC